MPRIFISYSRADFDTFVKEFAEMLVHTYGYEQVWYDQRLKGGTDWWKEILRQVRQADIFIYLLSNDSLDSDYCQAEYKEATRLQKQILTVQVRGRTKIPAELSRIQYVDMSRGVGDGRAVNQLHAAIKHLEQSIPIRPPRALWTPETVQPNLPTPEAEKAAAPARTDETVALPVITSPFTPPVSTPPARGRLPLTGKYGYWIAIGLMLGATLLVFSILNLNPPANPGTATPTATSGEIAGAASPTATDAMPTDPATETATAEPSATDMPTDEPTATDTLTDAPTDEPILTSTPTATATDQPTATHTSTPTASSTPTETPTPTLTPSLTSTVDIQAAAQTVVANQTAERIVTEATATAAQATLEQVLTETESAIQTATATAWTATPTFDLTLTIAAVLTDWQHQTETQVAANSTATADAWTDTPTPTYTPTDTPTPTHTPTDTPTFTPLELAMVAALVGVTGNDDWTPFAQDFDGVPMVLVPKGCYMMGSDTGDGDEKPVEQQCIDQPFWLDKYEVTNAAYGSTASGCTEYSSEPDQPRICISWFDARDFCASRGGRLPTEREWEFAARGPDGLVYPWGNEFVADNVVYGNNSGGKTALVGSRPGGISWVGALDLSGNVWEWVSSRYLAYPYDPAQAEDTEDANNPRVLRGGSWGNYGSGVRGANRDWFNPSGVNSYVGLRCARSYNSES